MEHESVIPPQYSYLNDILADFLQMNNEAANFQTYRQPKIRRGLLTCMIAFYMKIRGKIRKENEKQKKLYRRETGPYDTLLQHMDDHLQRNASLPDGLLLTLVLQMNNFMEETGATRIDISKAPLPMSQAIKGKFRQ